jgi:hypothetical protein
MFGIPFLTPKLAIQAGCVIAIVGALSFGAWSVVHSIRVDAVKDIVAADTATTAKAQAEGARIDAAQSNVDAKSAEENASHQATEAQAARIIKQKVYIHVHDPAAPPRSVGCVSVGLVRLHDAAALGVDPDALPLPAGSSDDACSAVTNAELAGAISDNYAAARANAAQLNDLIANVRGKVDATAPKK